MPKPRTPEKGSDTSAGSGAPEGAAADTEIAAVWMSIDELTGWDKNPRKNDHAVPKVAASIKRFGFGAPVLARTANKEVIAGHTRIKAAKSLGMTKVPVRLLDLDPGDAHLLAIADNRIGEEADWDEDKLAEVLRELKADGKDILFSGLDQKELDKLFEEEKEPDDPAPADPKSQFLVLVTCRDEAHQAEVLEKLMAEGLDVRALMS